MSIQMEGKEAIEILQYLEESGKIDLGDAEENMKKAKLNIILKEHPFKIYQGADGRWHTYVNDPEDSSKRKKISKSQEDDLYEALYDHYTGKTAEKKLEALTVETIFPKWLEYKELHTEAPSTITRLKSDWKKYYEGTPIVKVPLHKLTKLQLDEWIHKIIREHELTKKQYSNMITIMNQALDYAVDLEIIQENLNRKVKVQTKLFKYVKKKPSETQVFTSDEVIALKELAWEDFRKKVKRYELAPLAMIFQFLTGVRIGEVCALRYEDVEGSYIHVCRMVRRDSHEVVNHTKGGNEDRKVVLTSEAREIIETCRNRQIELGVESDGYIFSINGEYCSYFAVSDLYKKYCKKLEIMYRSSHKSRKTFISSLMDGRVNIDTIREMAGHADERTTLNSYCFDRNNVDERIAQIEEALAS